MILSIVTFVIFIVVMNTNEQAYLHGTGHFLTFFLLIFVRLFPKSWLFDRVAKQDRLHMASCGLSLSFSSGVYSAAPLSTQQSL